VKKKDMKQSNGHVNKKRKKRFEEERKIARETFFIKTKTRKR